MMKIKIVTLTLLLAGAAACSDDPNDGSIADYYPNPVGPVCMAVECVADTECSEPGKTKCYRQAGICAECSIDRHCVELAASNPAYVGREICRTVVVDEVPVPMCVCSSDTYCKANGLGEVCVAGACAGCAQDSDCDIVHTSSVTQGSCVGAGGPSAFCSECADDSECAGDAVCVGDTCVECREDSACGADELCLDNACATANCREDADCGDGSATPFCKGNTCVAAGCASDGECGALEMCVDSFCKEVECKAASDCADSPGGSNCIGAGTAGAFCACEVDGDCAGRGDSCVDGECRCDNSGECSVGGATLQCRNP